MHEVDDYEVGFEGGLPFHYHLDNVTLTTIGVDVGSSTFHFMFARVHLQRAKSDLSSRFEVVFREVLWRSPIRLTPYSGRLIDASTVSQAIAEGHEEADIAPGGVDSGAVILTGEALRTDNARAIGDALAASTGNFVCVSAGHHLESMLAAFGSGAVAVAHDRKLLLLHVDVGGGTTKLSVIDADGVRQTAAVIGGGRIVALDENRRIVRTSAGIRAIGSHAGVDLSMGATLTEGNAVLAAESLADVIAGIASGESAGTAESRLRLTPVLRRSWKPEAISFSGGVSEYIYGREERDFGDLGQLLGTAIAKRLGDGRIALPVIDLDEGIRATVIGAAQSSVQLSGSTVFVSRTDVLPLHNVPVIHPLYDAENLVAAEVARGVLQAMDNHGLTAHDPQALSITWLGEPSYARLHEVVAGVSEAFSAGGLAPIILLVDADVAASLGRQLVEKLPPTYLQRAIISLDGLSLKPLDYVDVGRIIEPANVLPVIIKSLLFEAPE